MFAKVGANGSMDRMAIALSGLCLVHCLASAIFVAMLASAGGLLLDPIIHEVGLTFAIGLGILALGRGVVDHGFMMPSAVGGLGLGVMAGSLSLHGDENRARQAMDEAQPGQRNRHPVHRSVCSHLREHRLAVLLTALSIIPWP